MNSRGLPQPQPSSVGSMVPGQAQGSNMTMGDLFAGVQGPQMPPKQGGTMAQALGREPAGKPPTDEELMAALGASQGPSDDEILKAIGENPNPQVPNDAMSGLKNIVKSALESKLGSRMAGMVGRSEKEQVSILKNIYGDDSVKVSDGKIQVKRKGEKKFGDFDPEGMDKLDVADFVGDLTEGVVAGLVETVGLGAAAGMAVTGNPFGGGVVAAATLPAGVKAGSMARDQMIRVLGGEVDEESQSLTRDTAFAAAGLGSSWAGAKVLKGISEIRNAPMQALRKLAVLNQSVDDFARSFWPTVQKETGEAGERLFGAITAKKKEMGEAIDMFYNKALSGLQDSKVPMQNYQKRLRDLLDEAGVAFDKEGLAKKNIKSFESKSPILSMERVDSWAGKTEGDLPRMRDVPKFSIATKRDSLDLTKDLGLDDGGSFVNSLIDRYNDGLKRARYGVNFGLDETRSISNGLAESADKVALQSPKHGYYLDQLADAARKDKFEGIKFGLKDPADIDAFTEINGKFASQIGDIRKFSRMWGNDVINENGDLFITNLVKKGNGNRLKSLRDIVGEYSPEWDMTRAAYIDDVIGKYTSDSTGIFDVKGIMNHFKGLGPEVTDVFLPRGRYNQLRRLSREFDKIDQTLVVDQKTLEHSAEFAKKMVEGSGIAYKVGSIAKSFFNMFRKNAYAADYLLDRGFIDFAKEATTAAERDSWMRVRNLYGKLIDSAAHVPRTGKKDWAMYATTNSTRELMRAMASSGAAASESVGDDSPLTVPAEFQ